MRILLLFLILISLISVGCTTTQKGAAVGATTGAVIGGVIGHQQGKGPAGAGIGAAVGAAAGALVGEQLETKFCPTCGAGYTGGTEFCPKDGAELKLKQK